MHFVSTYTKRDTHTQATTSKPTISTEGTTYKQLKAIIDQRTAKRGNSDPSLSSIATVGEVSTAFTRL